MNQLLSFPKDHFKKTTERPLTLLMIQTLKAACVKQSKGILFGPQDIKGSVIALITRGLIANHTVERHGKKRQAWYVTPQAIRMLADVDIKLLC